jgi:WD40 repeat protein
MKPKTLLCLALVLSGVLTAATADSTHTTVGRNRWRPVPDWDYDGKRILGHIGNDVCLWDASNGRLLKTFVGHGEQIFALQFSPDGKYALSSSWLIPGEVPSISKDTSVRLWDLAGGKQVYSLEGQVVAGFSPDSQHILTYSELGPNTYRFEAAVWNTSDGRLLFKAPLEPYCSPMFSSLQFSPDGRSYVCFEARNVVLRDASNGREIRRFRTTAFCFRFVAPDTILAIGSDEAAVWDLTTGRIVRRVKAPSGDADSTSDGRKIVGAWPRMMTVEVETGRVAGGPAPDSGSLGIYVSLLSPDDKIFAIEWNETGMSGTAELFDVNSCQKLTQVNLGDWGHLIGFSPDGATFLSGGSSFVVYSSKTGKPISQFNLLGNQVKSFLWTSHG